MNNQNNSLPKEMPFPLEPNPNEKSFPGFDIRDFEFYRKLSYYKEAYSARLFKRPWPSFSEYQMPESEVVRLEAGMDPFDFSSPIQVGRVVEVEREGGFQEAMAESARKAWLSSSAKSTLEVNLPSEDSNTERKNKELEAEREFAYHYIDVVEADIAGELKGTIQLYNTRRSAKLLYVKNYMTSPVVEKTGKSFREDLVEAARSAWMNSREKSELDRAHAGSEESYEKIRAALQMEEEFTSHFISKDNSLDSSEFSHRIQVSRERKEAKKLYYKAYLMNP